MSDLKELIEMCKASVSIEVNRHKDVYMPISEYMNEFPQSDFLDEMDPDILRTILATDTIVDLHFYPNTPIGFYKIYHYDIDLAIEKAIKQLRKEKRL